MAAYKMAAVKVTPPNDLPLGLIRPRMVVIHLFLMLCDLQRVVRDLCPTLYIDISLNTEIVISDPPTCYIYIVSLLCFIVCFCWKFVPLVTLSYLLLQNFFE